MRIPDPTRGDHILEMAAQLFAQRHYHEVRMEDIALQAGVAKGTIYRYFHDKEDLYLALILAASDRLFEEVQAALAVVCQPEEKLLIFVRRSIQFFRSYPYFLDLVQRVEVSSSIAADKLAALRASRQRFFDLVSAILVELNATGRYFAANPDLAALALTGMNRQILRFYPPPWPAHLAEYIVHQFLHGVAGDGSAPGSSSRTFPRRVQRKKQVIG